MDCPNCGRIILFEEQFEDFTHGAPQGSVAPGRSPADLDFNTKEVTLAEQIAKIPIGIKILLVFLPPLIALVLLLPNAMDSLGVSLLPKQTSSGDLPKNNGSVSSLDWSKLQDWNTSIDPREGTFDGYRVSREFTKNACTSDYQQIEKLFGYQKIMAEVSLGRELRKNTQRESLESLQRQASQLVAAFLEDSQYITNGFHDWRVIGVAAQADHKVLLMRYFRENATPLDLLDNEQFLLPLTKLITFDKFNLYCENIFKAKSNDRLPNARLMGYMPSNFFADKNFGYVVLSLSGRGRDMEIEDMFDYQIRKPLTQFCMVWMGAAGFEVNQVPETIAPLPGPADSDLRLIQNWVKNRTDKLKQFDRPAIRKTLELLYQQTKDPLMQDLLGRLEGDEGNFELASDYFRKAKAANFQSLELHRNAIIEAIQSQDQEMLTQRLYDLSAYWAVKLTGSDAEQDRKKYHKFQGYWRRGESL